MPTCILLLAMVTCLPGLHMHHGHADGPQGTAPHASEYRYRSVEEFRGAFHEWITSRPSIHTVHRLIDIVFSRLGVPDRVFCDREHGLSVAEAFKNTLVGHNVTYSLSDEQHLFGLFPRVLSVAAYAREVKPCCRHQAPEECTSKAEEYINLENKTVTQIFEILKARYNRHALPGQMRGTERMAFDVEAYANRFMCINASTLLMTVHFDHHIPIGEDSRKRILESALVFYILKGYNLLGIDDVCPGDYLYAIYKRYSRRGGELSFSGLNKVMHDLKYSTQENCKYSTYSERDIDKEAGKDIRMVPPGFDHPRPVEERLFQALSPEMNPFDDGQLGSASRNNGPHFVPQTSFLNYDRHYKGSNSPQRESLDARRLTDIFVERHEPPHEIPMSSFLDMCPALLYETLSKPCHHRPHPSHRPSPEPTTVSTTQARSVATASTPMPFVTSNTSTLTSNDTVTAEKMSRYKGYLYGSLAVLVISLCSILGAGFMKVSRADVKTYMMGSMLSLGVGCLVADAALHLLPEVILNENDVDSDELVPDYLRKMCAFLASIYAFFVLELILSIRHTHSHALDMEIEQSKSISLSYRKEDNKIQETNLNLNNKPVNANIPKTINVDHENNAGAPSNNTEHQRDNNIQVLDSRYSNTNQRHTMSRTETSSQVLESRCSNASDRISIHDAKSGVKALAWMIIIGDGIHNFADGLAIGAAFALTFSKGISTSITVLCHELPHELGDFAVLVSTGMSIKKAMLLNFLSSLTAFAGLYLGLALGEQEEASQWIFAVGAGMFIYVALTDLIPECKEYFKTKCNIRMFLGQNLGLLLGYVAMLLIAMYEDKLEIKA